MDWTQIVITALTLLIGGGGIVTLVTLRDRKNAALLDNILKVIESNSRTNEEWKAIAYEWAHMCVELKGDLDRKDGKIDELRKEKETLMETLDDIRTDKAIADVLKCTKTECTERHPPFGAGLNIESCNGCRQREG